VRTGRSVVERGGAAGPTPRRRSRGGPPHRPAW
jgi:hypothetical protein